MNLSDRIKAFLDELATDAVEERVVEYVIREARNGRRLVDTLNDPYVKNRLDQDRLAHVLENPEVVAAIEEAIANAFVTRDFGFAE